MVKREISKYLLAISKKYPVVTITGPRQSGKTTLAKSVFKEKEYVNLEAIDTREFAINDPRGFLRRLPKGAILDEIQRAPILLSYIQEIVDDTNKKGMFILTGSQQFEVSNSINQSLAGRTALLKLLPFSLSEVRKNYQFTETNELIYTGFYPRIYDDNLNPTKAYADYFETYVERDLRQLIQIKNLSQFQKFIKLCAGRTGQLLNLNNLGNDVGISHTTAREWLTILEASYIVFLLEPLHSNIKKRLVKSPKLYFYDVGLASFLLGIENISHLETHPIRGNLFENLIIIDALKYRFNRGRTNNLNFFRDSTGNEVDLIYTIGNNKIPIEIKAGETVSKDFFKGLNVYEKFSPNFSGDTFSKFVIYGGNASQTRGDTRILPYTKMVDALKSFNE